MIYRQGGQSSVWVVCGEVDHVFLRKGVEFFISLIWMVYQSVVFYLDDLS